MQNMGINQLANMFMGNPQPLEQKVQQAQQQAKPGQIPPDLKEALALQQIQDIRNAAGNQQAMQAGGPQPTVVEQLKQMLQQPAAPQQAAAPRPQGMPPGMPQGAPQGMPPQGMPQAAPPQGMPPVQAARGGHIAQLMSNLGRNYGSGGIIAFARGGDEGLDEEQRDKLRRIEAAYDPAVTERLNARAPAMPAEALAAARQGMADAAMKDPTAEQNAREAKFEKDVGPQDTSVIDKLMEEMARRKQGMEGPKEGLGKLLEYAQQVALTPKGLGALTSGAMGAQKVNELQQQREAGQYDLTKQMLEQQQKKLDSSRAYAKEKFGIGDAAYNAIYKSKFEAAKQITQNDFEADKLAKQMVSDELTRASNEKMAKERNENALKVANAPGQTERIVARIEKLRAQGTPEADAQIKNILDTHAQITGSGAAGVGAQRNKIMEMRLELASNQAILKDPDSTDAERAEARISIAELTRELSNSRIKPLPIGDEKSPPSGNKTPPPPPGYERQ